MISQREAGCDVLWKYGVGSSPYKAARFPDHLLRLQWRKQSDCARVHSEEYVLHGIDQTLQRRGVHGQRRRLPEPFSGRRPRKPPCAPTSLPCESVSDRTRPQCKESLRPQARGTPAGPRVHNHTGLRDLRDFDFPRGWRFLRRPLWRWHAVPRHRCCRCGILD